MPKRSDKAKIYVACWRCRWKGGLYLHLEDALDAMGRHTGSDKHGEAVRRLRGGCVLGGSEPQGSRLTAHNQESGVIG